MFKVGFKKGIQVTTRSSNFSSKLLHSSAFQLAKNDSSTIDSFRLPSQTSINEWEFRYDFVPKVSEPKIPPVTPEAVKQDIAHNKKTQIETELLNKEHASSSKVEANAAQVVHGGESVTSQPEYIQDRGSKPIDAFTNSEGEAKRKPANRDKYVHSSINPNINQSEVVNLGESEVHHKVSEIDKQTPVVDDIEHDDLNKSRGESAGKSGTSKSKIGISAALGAIAGVYYYYSVSNKDGTK